MPEKTLREALVDVADAIRAKTSSQETMTIEEMPGEIASIETGIIPTGTKSITANGNGIDVYNYASVNVNVPSVQPSGIAHLVAPGNYNVSAYASANIGADASNFMEDSDLDGFDALRKRDSKVPTRIKPFKPVYSSRLDWYSYDECFKVSPLLQFNMYIDWTNQSPTITDYDGGYMEGMEPYIIIAGLCDENYYDENTRWAADVYITYSSYNGSYTQEEVTQQVEDLFSGIQIKDLSGRIVGYIPVLGVCDVTLEEGC